MNWRNLNDVECARLKDTEHLCKSLSKSDMLNVVIEPKLDGHRVTLQYGGGFPAVLTSRGRHNKHRGVAVSKGEEFLTSPAPEWAAGLESRGLTVIDGEMIGFVDGASAGSMAGRLDARTVFVAFDLLVLNGEDMRPRSLTTRRAELQSVVHADFGTLTGPKGTVQELLDHQYDADIAVVPQLALRVLKRTDIDAMLRTVVAAKVEGLVVKKTNLPYEKNSYGWKIKAHQSHDGIVIGAKPGKDHRLGVVSKTDEVGVLIVAQYDGGPEPVLSAYVPCRPGVKMTDAHTLIGDVVEFTSQGWDDALKLWRFPQFTRFRTDKPPEDCTRDNARLT